MNTTDRLYAPRERLTDQCLLSMSMDGTYIDLRALTLFRALNLAQAGFHVVSMALDEATTTPAQESLYRATQRNSQEP
jgi:hypothetical protein